MEEEEEEEEEEGRSSSTPGLQFTARVEAAEEELRLQLIQHCCCCYGPRKTQTNVKRRGLLGKKTGSSAGSEKTSSSVPTLEPVNVTAVDYNKEMEMYDTQIT